MKIPCLLVCFLASFDDNNNFSDGFVFPGYSGTKSSLLVPSSSFPLPLSKTATNAARTKQTLERSNNERRRRTQQQRATTAEARNPQNRESTPSSSFPSCPSFSSGIASLLLGATLFISALSVAGGSGLAVPPAHAADGSIGGGGAVAGTTVVAVADEDAVEEVLKSLKDAGGDPTKIFGVYETIAEIISEGKGVGGAVTFEGVQLNRGYVADEDTSIYNPGLSLLTETEKNAMVSAVIESRKMATSWPEENELAFREIKEKLDPFRMTELSGYLGIVPTYGSFLYLGVLAVQQFLARTSNNQSIFTISYLVAVAAIFLPAVILILTGV